mmetsp:Transcript_22784/g.56291  ORF Transcript_22784/g.56291 Transcript_22784/m.56291 type:complete len:388 (-) Transcript_22784:306-1469(-)
MVALSQKEIALATTLDKNVAHVTASHEEKLNKMPSVLGLYVAVILVSLFFLLSMNDITKKYTSSFVFYVASPTMEYNETVRTKIQHHQLGSAYLRHNDAEPHHSAAICVIQKSTLKYFEEWILYNIAIGFEIFYLYDNSDEPEAQNWLEKQSKQIQGRVNVTHWPGVKQQVKAYLDCWRKIRYAKSHSWIAFFDVDEFLVIKNLDKFPTIMDLLDSLPSTQYGLAVNWVNFGYNGRMKYEDKPVTMRFQNRPDNGTSVKIKSLVRAQVSPKMKNPHYIKYKLSKSKSVYMSRDSRGNVVQGPMNSKQEVRDVALYHYATKSLEEYKDRCARGDVLRGQADWATMPWCASDEEIMKNHHMIQDEPVHDDRPWKLLQERAPEYTNRYNS